jgi:hypothetical protein
MYEPLMSIGVEAFFQCSSLRKLWIPAMVTVGARAFETGGIVEQVILMGRSRGDMYLRDALRPCVTMDQTLIYADACDLKFDNFTIWNAKDVREYMLRK